MSTYLVTGSAGFIGSHLTHKLLARGHSVIGIDSLTDFYDRAQKKANLRPLLDFANFRAVERDLNDPDFDLLTIVAGVDGVFHQAGQPGVRPSWDLGFAAYASRNILATQRLLESVRVAGVKSLVYASSSSIYGNADVWPCTEDTVPRPFSPYGVTKLAAEHLVSLYAENYGLDTTSLRYFTVYGPGQRPDMAMNRFINSALTGQEVVLYGTGRQIRDFTYVGDIVEANILAMQSSSCGGVMNVSGGSQASVREVLDIIEDVTEHKLNLRRLPAPPGDVLRTGGSNTRVASVLGWSPRVDVRSGLERQVQWHSVRNGGGAVSSVLQVA